MIEYTDAFCFKFIVKLQDLLHTGVKKFREDWSFILTYVWKFVFRKVEREVRGCVHTYIIHRCVHTYIDTVHTYGRTYSEL